MRRTILAAVLLSLWVGSVPAGVQPPSRLTSGCAHQVMAVAGSYEAWADTVCPVFCNVIQLQLRQCRPSVATQLARVYESTLCTVADAKIREVVAITRRCQRSCSDVTSVADEAVLRIQTARDRCIGALRPSRKQPPARVQQAPPPPAAVATHPRQ